MAHGDTYEHVKRWLKQRFTFVDTLFDYAPSYNNDVLTIRANTTELMTLEIETYTPVYQHVSWYNGQMDKKKIDGKVSVEFSGTAQAATDQEVLIYGGSNVKSIKGITSMNPNRMLIGSATKLVELDAHDCPLLADINANKANLSPHEYLNKVNLSNCPLLEGNLRLNNSPLVQELDIRGTNITEMNLPGSIRNLQVLRLPNTMTDLTLNDANMLHTLEFDEGVNLQSINMTNCNALENVINFDLLQTPSITLNNSYNTVAELYFRDTTNLSLSNMTNLERVIFTPNNEYETFDLINVANAPNYKVTTFNCPKLSTFMTTAPYRESYMVNTKYIGLKLPGKTRTELEYIETDGSQYINTGYVGTSNTTIVMDVHMSCTKQYQYWFGSINMAVQFSNINGSSLTIRGLEMNPYVAGSPLLERGIFTFNSTNQSSKESLCIFGGYYQDAFEPQNKGIGKLYSFKIYEGTKLIHDYIPCKDEDGIVCLYDNITNEFLYPDGALIAGSEADVSDKLVETWDKGYGDIQPNTTFTANSIDISNTQFTDVKLLCTTDTNTLKLPTTVKNFYCDSSFDLDTDYLEDGEYDVVHGELIEPYTTDYEGEVLKIIDGVFTDVPYTTWKEGVDLHPVSGGEQTNASYKSSDFIEVKGGTTFASNTQVYRLIQYRSDKTYNYASGNTTSRTLESNTCYVRITVPIDATNVMLSYEGVSRVTPNLIPSSADGSLIFSMYAPSNTVAPASGTWDLKGLKFDNFHTFGMNNDVKQDSKGNISMPARYDDYNITIKNANISPKTHNTMLYPLLVNEDNPIEGKLDYTNYNGEYLSWSFAYVNMNKVNIVQPKDELLNTYKYRYNAFYETEYEFDDPNEVLRYITSSSNLLPTFNEGFTYTYDKLDNNDGTYIYRIYANDPTLLTSFELEKVPYLRITNAENLLSPIDLTKYETVSISESYYDITELYFSEATNLTLTNMPYLERVIYLPNDEYEVFEIINVVNSKDYIITTSECPRLTTFMTTASHRESYNNEDVIAEVITELTNTDNELFTNEYVFSKTYWEEDGTEIQGSVNLLHYEIPSIEDSVKAIHMVQGLDSTNRVTFFNDDKFISCEVITTACELDFKLHRDCNRIVFICEREGIVSSVVESILTTTLVKEYGSVEPNIIFNANTLDISNTQFTDVKLLCTTDLNVLKLPTTVKNFYCDSSFDLDTNYLTDGEYNAVHGELVEQYTTDYEDEVVKIKQNEVEILLRDIDTEWRDGYWLNPVGNEYPNTNRCVSDYIRVVPNTRFILSKDGITQYVNIGALVQYDINKQCITGGNWVNNVTLDTNCAYIRLDHTIVGRDEELPVITFTPYIEYTPNLIPSSADGSLIFSMYAPSKTVAPASGTWDLYGLEFDNFHTFGMNNDVKQDSKGNISMSSRYNNYNITIKNANISPKTHNTMLYPLLVNEDNPIEGKLDYTDYNGEYLSWSFAYTNTNKVNIIQPKDELLNSYEYRYNAFYRTEYEFDNPNEVMEYTTTSSNLLPIFNEGFTYAYDKIDNDDGTYTYKIYANDISLLTSFELEKVPYLRIINAENLVSPIDLTKYEVIEIDNSYNSISELYFKDATDLTLNNIPNLERVIYVPNSEYDTFELINITNAPNYNIATFNCPKLSTFMTTAPYRESYNNCGMRDKVIQVEEHKLEYLAQDYTPKSQAFSFAIDSIDFNNQSIVAEIDLTKCTSVNENILSFGSAIGNWSHSSALHIYYTKSSATLRVSYMGNTLQDLAIEDESKVKVTLGIQGLSINDGNYIVNGTITNNILVLNNLSVGSTEGQTRSNATYKYIGYGGFVIVDHVTQIKDYGDIQPNTAFTANSIDISSTQFTDVKLLCTTDTNTLKLPTTIKNFYCDSSFDLDTDYLEDGEYDVVHGELIEPYTTDYEGEVVRFSNNETSLLMKDICTIPNSYINEGTGEAVYHYTYSLSDFIEVVSGTRIALNFWVCRVSEYNAAKSYIKQTTLYNDGTQILILDSNCKYIRVHVEPYYLNDINVITCTPLVTYVPNLIPSSADGSLIFSMYAPSKTVQPASNTWDLYGLEFDNFHTYGMNNDVKGECNNYLLIDNLLTDDKFNTTETVNFTEGEYIEVSVDLSGHTTNELENVIAFGLGDINTWGSDHKIYAYYNGSSKELRMQLCKNNNISGIKPIVNGTNLTIRFDKNGIWYNGTLATGFDQFMNEWVSWFDNQKINIWITNDSPTGNIHYNYIMVKHKDIYSLTMPARYDDYNITIKNAYISPKTHNTMLYPLLVNEDNPITGTLDYTNYEGKHLSWSFAYTDKEYVDIIQPKDELLNSYEYRYNAFYDTEYEFDNPYEIARYTSSASGVLPEFNKEFTYTYDETDNGDGTYTTKIYADSMDNLPTKIIFQNIQTLKNIHKLNISNVTSMANMFNGCSALIEIKDIGKWDVSNVTDLDGIFKGCKSITSLDLTNWQLSNVTSNYGIAQMFMSCSNLTEIKGVNNLLCSGNNIKRIDDMFNGCRSLTMLDLSDWDASNVTDISSMFNGCSGLTSLNISNFDTGKVTNMKDMFSGCTSLTSLDISNFSTSSVTNMQGLFYNCSNLTSLDVSNFNTSKVANMQSMFFGCNHLVTLDLSNFNTSEVTTMEGMFYGCSSLKEVKGIENWDCSKVAKFGSMFQVATAFGGDLDLRNWKVGQNTTVTSIYNFMNGCANLKSVDMSGWVLPDNMNFANFMSNQGSLHTIRVIGWSAINIQNLRGAIGYYVGGTIYGDVIIDESYLENNWTYNNVLEVAIYTCSTSGVLPIFNTEFTYTHSETSNEDGTYTTKVVANSIDNLPTKCSFEYKTSLLRVDKLNTSELTTMYYMFNNCSFLTYINSNSWDTSKVTNMSGMFANCSRLTSVNTTGWDTIQITNMGDIFNNCTALTEIMGIENWDTSKVTNMSGMFSQCKELTSLDISNWKTGQVVGMGGMFYGVHIAEPLNLNKWDVSKVTDMMNMFRASHYTSIDISSWDTSNVAIFETMFMQCKATELKLPSKFVRSIEGKITNMYRMFNQAGVISLDVTEWDTQNINSLIGVFMMCVNLTEIKGIENWNTSKITSMNQLFYQCKKLTSLNISEWETGQVTDMGSMFQECEKLETIDMTKWDTSKVASIYCMFKDCVSLTSLDMSRFTNCKDMGSFCINCTNLVTITGLDTSKYSTNFGGSVLKLLKFEGCTSLRNIKNINVSFTSAMATVYGNSVNDSQEYWMTSSWQWFNGLTNLVDITFTGQLELYDTMSTYKIFKGCDTRKFTNATWNTFVSIFPTTPTSKSIVMGSTQAILDAVPDEIKLALTEKGYTLTFMA